MMKHMSESLRVRNGSKGILENFGKLSPSKLIIRAQLMKKEEKLINMVKNSWTEMKLILPRRYCIDKCPGQISLINLV
jgi:hypothetical protein